jgi:hypothetical protein
MILGLELEAVEGKISMGSNVPIIIHTIDYMSYPHGHWVLPVEQNSIVLVVIFDLMESKPILHLLTLIILHRV